MFLKISLKFHLTVPRCICGPRMLVANTRNASQYHDALHTRTGWAVDRLFNLKCLYSFFSLILYYLETAEPHNLALKTSLLVDVTKV